MIDFLLYSLNPFTMNTSVAQFDVVALLQDLPALGLVAGQVGTIVESLQDGVFEVDFCDNDGRSYATGAVAAKDFIVLHYSPVAA